MGRHFVVMRSCNPVDISVAIKKKQRETKASKHRALFQDTGCGNNRYHFSFASIVLFVNIILIQRRSVLIPFCYKVDSFTRNFYNHNNVLVNTCVIFFLDCRHILVVRVHLAK